MYISNSRKIRAATRVKRNVPHDNAAEFSKKARARGVSILSLLCVGRVRSSFSCIALQRTHSAIVYAKNTVASSAKTHTPSVYLALALAQLLYMSIYSVRVIARGGVNVARQIAPFINMQFTRAFYFSDTSALRNNVFLITFPRMIFFFLSVF